MKHLISGIVPKNKETIKFDLEKYLKKGEKIKNVEISFYEDNYDGMTRFHILLTKEKGQNDES
jgi:hypothetical protein